MISDVRLVVQTFCDNSIVVHYSALISKSIEFQFLSIDSFTEYFIIIFTKLFIVDHRFGVKDMTTTVGREPSVAFYDNTKNRIKGHAFFMPALNNGKRF